MQAPRHSPAGMVLRAVGLTLFWLVASLVGLLVACAGLNAAAAWQLAWLGGPGPAPVAAPRVTPAEAPVRVTGTGTESSAVFVLRGGDYRVTWHYVNPAAQMVLFALILERPTGGDPGQELVSGLLDARGIVDQPDWPMTLAGGRYAIAGMAATGGAWTVGFVPTP